MIRSYIKIAWRNLVKDKSFSIINIAGLAIGMAAAILIMLWIAHEKGYDQFHTHKDRIYEAWNKVNRDGQISVWNTTPRILAPTLKKDYPEVEHAVRVDWNQSLMLEVGEKKLKANGSPVDSNFFSVFSFPMVKGDPVKALIEPTAIVLTEQLSHRLFGEADPMGKIIKVDNRLQLKVTGVVQDLPKNTRFDFEYLLPWSLIRLEGGDDQFWGNNSTETYVMLKPNTDKTSLDAKLKGLRRKYDKDDPEGEIFLYPMERWRLFSRFDNGKESGGMIEFVRLFGIIGIFILLIACINFMNLSTARSEKRAREVGIRKVSGAGRSSLVAQFLSESLMVSFFAGLLALAIVELSLPAFNALTERQLSIDYRSSSFWTYFLGFVWLTGLLAGSYPAFFLSSFQPIRVLKGKLMAIHGTVTPRKVLVVLQFTIAIVLTIGTIIIRQQIQHAQERQPGYNRDNLVFHFLTGDLDRNYTLLKNELLATGVAKSVTRTSAPMTEGWSNTWGIGWAGKAENDRRVFDRFCADDKFAATTGLQITQGRDLDLQQYPTDSNAVLLNESAAKMMGFKDPIGQILRDNGQDWHVVGVFRDFILQSPYRKTEPMVVEGARGWFNVVHIRLNGERGMAANMKQLEDLFQKYNPVYPVELKFVDEQYGKKFANEQRTGKLVSLFTILTVLISCLGLFGLSAYMAEARVREIGIRKVLGASVSAITTLLSRDFLKLVLIALLIAIPAAWWAMHSWLEKFEYRVNMQWWYFVLAGLIAIVIALVTVSYQAIRAALSNPVKSLRAD